MIRAILFDLDDTLYPGQVGIMGQIRILILRYLHTRLHLSPEEAEAVRRDYLRTYGTTMRGLQINHHIDADEFLDYVHDIPLDEYLQPNPELDAALASIPQEKVVFTNASREHAERVLRQLGIRQHFSRIVDVRDVGFESKPQPFAYRRICDLLDVRPEECLLVEDNVRNLRPGKALGMVTVLVGDDGSSTGDGVDYAIPRIEEIGQVIELIRRAHAPVDNQHSLPSLSPDLGGPES
jgi:putative hydrolase of the HAD superfamily